MVFFSGELGILPLWSNNVLLIKSYSKSPHFMCPPMLEYYIKDFTQQEVDSCLKRSVLHHQNPDLKFSEILLRFSQKVFSCFASWAAVVRLPSFLYLSSFCVFFWDVQLTILCFIFLKKFLFLLIIIILLHRLINYHITEKNTIYMFSFLVLGQYAKPLWPFMVYSFFKWWNSYINYKKLKDSIKAPKTNKLQTLLYL